MTDNIGQRDDCARFFAHKDEHGYYDSIDDADGNVVVHLQRGTVRNEKDGGVVRLLAALNSRPAIAAALREQHSAHEADEPLKEKVND